MRSPASWSPRRSIARSASSRGIRTTAPSRRLDLHLRQLRQRCGGARKSLGGIFREKPIDEALEAAVLVGQYGNRLVAMGVQDRDDRVAAKGSLARQHFVE